MFQRKTEAGSTFDAWDFSTTFTGACTYISNGSESRIVLAFLVRF
jgi:hypothetical protein